MSLFMVGLDNTIVNVALPSIGASLRVPVSGLQWTVDAYVLVLASLLMLAGATADRIGRRRTFQTGLVVFTAGSLLCGFAPGLGWLIAFRVLQAVGGSMLNPVAMSIITNTFTDPRERASAIGVWGGVNGLSLALGPVLGGALVNAVGWRLVFWINVPFGIAALVLTALFVPESRSPRPRRADPLGQVLVFIMLAALTYGFIEGPGAGWASPGIVACFGLAVVALLCLLLLEPLLAEPLLDPRFFRNTQFTGATVVAVCAFAAMAGFLFVNTLYLQEVRGLTALRAGLYTLPIAAMSMVFSPLSGRLVAARGPRLSMLVAGAAITVSCVPLYGLHDTTAPGRLLSAYAVFGIGFGMVNPPITNAAVSGMPREQAGVAAAVASTSRQVGAALGVAVIGSAVTAGLVRPLSTGFAAASHVAWFIITGLGLTILAVGLWSTSVRARRTVPRYYDEPVEAGAHRLSARQRG
jgi:EmrB/QacA subfamily drug resistance transporter